MKKLLALILCVMLFVSVIPTAAFAADSLFTPAASGSTAASIAKDIKAAIAARQAAIEKAYGTLAGDKAVYASVKVMDDMVVAMSKALAENVGKAEDADVIKATNTALRTYIGAAVSKAIEGKDFSEDPVKYAEAFAAGVNKAFTDPVFQKTIEKAFTDAALENVKKSVNEALAAQFADFKDSIDPALTQEILDEYGLDLKLPEADNAFGVVPSVS